MSRRLLRQRLAGIVAAAALTTTFLMASPAAAQQDVAEPLPQCKAAPARVWQPGAPQVPTESEQRIEALNNRYPGVFAGAAYTADHKSLDLFYKSSLRADAERLLAGLGDHARYANLVAQPYNYVELESAMQKVINASSAIDGLEAHSWGPDVIRGGIRVEVRSQPTAEVQKLAFETLVPLGMVFMCIEKDVPSLYPSPDTDWLVTDGTYTVNGRQWRIACEPYSQVERCRTEIMASVVTFDGGKFTLTNGWAFNNLTYTAGPRSLWEGNPLAETGTWRDADGRQWRSECGTPATGRDACRSYVSASVIATTPNGYEWRNVEVYNNQVRFG